MVVQGERMAGGFILITGIDGTRYAVRHHAIAVIHDADECHDETIVQLCGGQCRAGLVHTRRSAGMVRIEQRNRR